MSWSKKTRQYLSRANEYSDKIERPDWQHYFMSFAILASTRSNDSQTKHGCVITDNKNRILGIGYNGFPSGMNDKILPNKRPYKYKWMVHAERNALSNCTLRPENGIAYITGKPCVDCAMSLYQEGIRNFVCIDGHGTHLHDSDDECVFEILQKDGQINVSWINPDFEVLRKVLEIK
jgi:dCMP deaminase